MARVAVVTGAARGIGRACAERLGADGYTVIAADIDGAAVATAAAELAAAGATCEAHALDVADVAAGRDLIDGVVRRYGGVDALVNNAGFTERVYVADLDPERWRRMLAVHVRGPVFLTQRVAQALVRRGAPGSIVNISSIRAETAEPGQIHYCTAKGALRTLTRAIAQELAPHRIRVNCVGPGLTATDMTAEVRRDPAALTQRQARVPLGRYGQPSEIAACVAYLLSDAAAYVTGATLYADGGYLAG